MREAEEKGKKKAERKLEARRKGGRGKKPLCTMASKQHNAQTHP